MSRDFLFLVFFMNQFPPSPRVFDEYRFDFFPKIRGDIRKSRCSTGGKQWEQLSNCWQLKINLKKKIHLYANSPIQRCPKEIMTIFLIEDFFHLPPVSTAPVVHLELWISKRIFEKIRNGSNGAWGNWSMLKTWSQKSRDTIHLRCLDNYQCRRSA